MANIKKNFIYQTVYQIMSMILPLITSPILSRTLGADGLGTYSYVFSIVGYLILIANLGMYKYGIRSIASTRDNKNELSRVFWEIWKLHLILCFFVSIIYVFLLIFIWKEKILFCIMFIYFIGSILNINWLFFGLEEFGKIAVRDMVIKLISFFMIIFLIRTKDNLTTYFLINSISNLVSNLIYWFMYKKYVIKVKVYFKNCIVHLKSMILLFIPALLETLYYSMDKVMLGIICTKSAVGYYENADKALIARTMIFSITTVLMPRMANVLARNDMKEFHRLMKQTTGITLILASAFAFGTASIAREFSVVFWGKDFIKCTTLIIIMAMAMPAVVLSREIREQYLIPANKDKEYIYAAASGALSNLVINLLLIPCCGALGAAIATLLSEYIVLIVQLVVVKEELPMYKYIHGNEIYFMFGFIMFVLVRIVGVWFGFHIYTLVFQIFLGGIIYFLLCVGYWSISKQNFYFDLLISLLRRKK